jgi:Protein of unknown function (DUF3606)
MNPPRGRPGMGVADHLKHVLPVRTIDVTVEYELQYWGRALGVGREALLAAVEAVGSDARAVSRKLGKG